MQPAALPPWAAPCPPPCPPHSSRFSSPTVPSCLPVSPSPSLPPSLPRRPAVQRGRRAVQERARGGRPGVPRQPAVQLQHGCALLLFPLFFAPPLSPRGTNPPTQRLPNERWGMGRIPARCGPQLPGGTGREALALAEQGPLFAADKRLPMHVPHPYRPAGVYLYRHSANTSALAHAWAASFKGCEGHDQVGRCMCQPALPPRLPIACTTSPPPPCTILPASPATAPSYPSPSGVLLSPDTD